MKNIILVSKSKGNNAVLNSSAYTLKEAAIILRRSTKTVSRLIARGKLRRDETFWRVRIPRKDVDSYMDKNSEYAFSV